MQTRTRPGRRLAGVEVRLDASVLVLVALVVWAFTGVFTAEYPTAVAVALATVGAVLVVLTTLAHELGHALEARYRGMEVEGITLLLFGGVTELHTEGQTARDELAVAVVGPWVSLVCAALFGLLATFADVLLPTAAAPAVAQIAGVLGWWNLLLAVFNLVPGAPLDGGRVLRALLWMALGDRLRALRISVRAGQVIGAGLAALGAATLWRAGASASLVAAALVLSGAFLIRSAASELRHAELSAALERHRVGELLTAPVAVDDDGVDRPDSDDPDLPGVGVEDDLHTLVEAFDGPHDRVRVLSEGRLLGVLSEAEVARAVGRLRRGEPLT